MNLFEAYLWILIPYRSSIDSPSPNYFFRELVFQLIIPTIQCSFIFIEFYLSGHFQELEAFSSH